MENPEYIYGRFKTKNRIPELKPNNNVAPSQMVPIVFGDREVELMKWNLVPSWVKDEKIGYKMINARAEGIEVKASFARPFHTQRCIVHATGFYKWMNVDNGKVPLLCHQKNHEMFGIAGLFDFWKDKESGKLTIFTIITTRPNKLVSKVHDRM